MSIAPTPPATAVFDCVVATAFSGSSLGLGLARWRSLEHRIGRQGWACSTEWVEAYVDHYGDFAEIECVIVSCDGDDIGAGLLSRKTLSKLGPLGFRALLNGTGGEPDGDPFYCEHHQLLSTPDCYPVVEEAVTTRALQRDGVDAVYWSGYKLNHGESLRQRDSRCHVSEFTHAAIDLTVRSPREIKAAWIDNVDEAAPHIGRLIEWNRDWWSQDSKGLYTGRFERFLFDVVCRLLKSGRAAIVANESSCVVLLFDEPQPTTLFAYADGAPNDEAMREIHMAAADLAAARGFQRYDLPVDPADGVDEIGDLRMPLLWVRIAKLTWRSQLLFGLSRVKRALSR